MLWRGIEIEPQWVVLALLLVAAAMGRGRQFVFDFVPFLLLFFAYEVMRGFAAKTGFAPHDISQVELWLFKGELPTVVLQRALYDPDHVRPLDLAATFFYFMHFVLPVVVGFAFWLRSREHYWRYVAALLLLSLLAFVTYLFFPSTPPWIEFQDGQQVAKVSDATIAKLHVDYYVSPLYSRLDSNRFAAFPSLHAAYPAVAAIFAWRRYPALAIGLMAWAVCVWFSIVYLGEHYVVDVLCGLVYVAVAAFVVQRFKPRGAAVLPADRADRASRLPDALHDQARKLVGVVVRGDAAVHDVPGDEPRPR
jgi:membrane-associated phospholipid phosphatase